MCEFPLHCAAFLDDLERVRQLIEEGMSVNSRDDLGRTPLHCAAEQGRYAVVDFLSCHPECDLDIKACDGRTPVLCAANDGKKHVVDLLLQRGAQKNCVTDHKWTLLHYASLYDWTNVVCLILNSGEADGNQSDAQKRTALHNDAFHGHTQVVQVLLEKEGLDLNPQDEDGYTPLHWACIRGFQEIVKQLLVAGADINIRTNDGGTALVLCIRGQRIEEIRLLVQGGVFLQDCEYKQIYENRFLKENILNDVGLCTQSIVTKFHRQSLPALDSISYFARKLPNIDKFKLNARQIDEVENLVKWEIERNTFCNVVKAHPMALSALCVLSLITCQSGMKRSASPDFGDSNLPFKKLQ